MSASTARGGDVTSAIFLIFGLILISEYELGRYAILVGGAVAGVAYSFALVVGYRAYSPAFATQVSGAVIGVICLIILFGAVLLRHELRHRQDRDLLEARVKERTAELERALAERLVMLQEIHHRVKNNLQMVISMLRLESEKQVETASRAALETSIQRIYAMSLVHETLYATEQLDRIDLGRYADGLLESARTSPTVDFSLKAAEGVIVGLDVAVPFGLLLNELVSNAERHAFPSGARGRVDIRIESGADLLLTIADDGVGMAEEVQVEGAKTLGLSLVNVLVTQLGGSWTLDRRPGTRWTVRFPRKLA